MHCAIKYNNFWKLKHNIVIVTNKTVQSRDKFYQKNTSHEEPIKSYIWKSIIKIILVKDGNWDSKF